MRIFSLLLLLVLFSFNLYAQLDTSISKYEYDVLIKFKDNYEKLEKDTVRLHKLLEACKKKKKPIIRLPKKKKKDGDDLCKRSIEDAKKEQKKEYDEQIKDLNIANQNTLNGFNTLNDKYNLCVSSKKDLELQRKKDSTSIINLNDNIIRLQSDSSGLASDLSLKINELNEERNANKVYNSFYNSEIQVLKSDLSKLLTGNNFYGSEMEIVKLNERIRLIQKIKKDDDLEENQNQLKVFSAIYKAFKAGKKFLSMDYERDSINQAISLLNSLEKLQSNNYIDKEKRKMLSNLRGYCKNYKEIYSLFEIINGYETKQSIQRQIKRLDDNPDYNYIIYPKLKEVVGNRKRNLMSKTQPLKNIGTCNNTP